MKKIGIFYGPVDGATERVAKRIAIEFGIENIAMVPVKVAKKEDSDNYEYIIFGAATIGKETWDSKEPSKDWDIFYPKMDAIDFTNKTIAIFGLGDQIRYPQHFVDAIGMIAEKVKQGSGKIVGQVSIKGYNFEDSEAIENDHFLGLPIDEDNESDLTEQRIIDWVSKLKVAFGL